jgi:hypothetical protein
LFLLQVRTLSDDNDSLADIELPLPLCKTTLITGSSFLIRLILIWIDDLAGVEKDCQDAVERNLFGTRYGKLTKRHWERIVN